MPFITIYIPLDVDNAIVARQNEFERVCGEFIPKDKLIPRILEENLTAITEKTKRLKHHRIKI